MVEEAGGNHRPLINFSHKVVVYHSMFSLKYTSCCGFDCMVVGFTTTYEISAYHH
jgi:hypothetical protein